MVMVGGGVWVQADASALNFSCVALSTESKAFFLRGARFFMLSVVQGFILYNDHISRRVFPGKTNALLS